MIGKYDRSGPNMLCKYLDMMMCGGDFSSKVGLERSQYFDHSANRVLRLASVTPECFSVMYEAGL